MARWFRALAVRIRSVRSDVEAVCECDSAVSIEPMGTVLWTRECRKCGAWDTVSKPPFQRRCAVALGSILARYTDPEDVFATAWLP